MTNKGFKMIYENIDKIVGNIQPKDLAEYLAKNYKYYLDELIVYGNQQIQAEEIDLSPTLFSVDEYYLSEGYIDGLK
jgi:hypothetical protein